MSGHGDDGLKAKPTPGRPRLRFLSLDQEGPVLGGLADRPTHQNMALRTQVAAFNWAKGQGLISGHCPQNPKAV
jgi:hypothetical protein